MGESWHQRLARLAEAGDYASALATLRAPYADAGKLSALLLRARLYVADALDAHEHSDGRDLLNEIDAALSPLPQQVS